MKFPSCIKRVELPTTSKCKLTAEESADSRESTTPRENITAEPSSVEYPTNAAKPEESQQQQQQQQQSSEKKSIDDARLCKICYNEELGVVFVPCGHIVTCVKCAPGMTNCAVCRKKVELTVRAFFS